MEKFGKWIAAGLGWAFFGPVGGILGFVVGSFFEGGNVKRPSQPRETTTGDFAMSLLVLIAAVMKADNKVVKGELDYVKSYFVKTFGMASAQEAILMLRDLLKQKIPLKDVAVQIGQRLDYSSKLEMLHLLFEVAFADGELHESEVIIIEKLGSYMGIGYKDVESIKAMYTKEEDASYKVLEIESDATDDEVRKAYKNMAMKYHPDKVEYLGEDFKKVATEKFKKVNEAYEKIKSARGMA